MPTEYEYRELTFHRLSKPSEVRRALTEAADVDQWELARMSLFMGGVRRATLRRRIIRVARTVPPGALRPQ